MLAKNDSKIKRLKSDQSVQINNDFVVYLNDSNKLCKISI